MREQTAEQSLEITQERFQAGAINYLSLLDAQRHLSTSAHCAL
jgi:outer membrane protein TolC